MAIRTSSSVSLLMLLAVGCTSVESRSAQDVRPLGVGARVPLLMLTSAEGRPFDLNAAVAQRPTVLVFYRGGWCPYCNVHLGQLAKVESTLKRMGYQILAVSPDRPEKLRESVAKHSLSYTLLSDSDLIAARAFGLEFRVADETVDLYKTKYNIDLEAASGRTHHMLPVPAVFLVDTDGAIRFAHADPDYKRRLDPDVLLAAAKSVLKQK